MEIKGAYKIAASREKVWAALNDPDILKKSLPGCEKLEKESDTAFTATIKAKVGPVSARFSGAVTLQDLDPPNGYRIVGEGKGGVAGFAKGGAKVSLRDDGGDTVLEYDAEAKVGGKLAQIGSRLVLGTARKLADDFFKKFAETVAGTAAEKVALASEGQPQ
jgi:carbon monoxide dehydrogenase subunit G